MGLKGKYSERWMGESMHSGWRNITVLPTFNIHTLYDHNPSPKHTFLLSFAYRNKKGDV